MKPWDRPLWGVLHQTAFDARHGATPSLLGDAWKLPFPERHARAQAGEPPHVLLFTTRKAAREWCREAETAAKLYSLGWTFRPVRVRETVVVV